MSFSEEYQEQLQQLHAAKGDRWGTTGARNFGDHIVTFLKKRPDVRTVLDFGAGQCTLERYVKENYPAAERLRWTNYDPGIPGLQHKPREKFNLVLSSDVLEHVETDHVDETIQELREYTERNGYMYHFIACEPAKHKLPDGRDVHLTVRDPSWWRDKFAHDHWCMMYYAHQEQHKRGFPAKSCVLQLDRLR